MKNHLNTKKSFVSQEKLIISTKESLEKTEKIIHKLHDLLDDEYKSQTDKIFHFLKKEFCSAEFRAMKKEFDGNAKKAAREEREKNKAKAKKYCVHSAQSLNGLAKVAEILHTEAIEHCRVFKETKSHFELSKNNPQIMFNSLIRLEKLSAEVTAIQVVINFCQIQQEQQAEKFKQEMNSTIRL